MAINKGQVFFIFLILSLRILAAESLETVQVTPAAAPQPTPLPSAQPTQASGTSITSEKLEIALGEDQSEFLFTGNVKLSASLFSAECAAAKIVTFGKIANLAPSLDSIKQISITGPLLVQQGERSCSADRAEITTADTTIILFGNARVQDPMGTVTGNEIRINYTTKNIEISGTPNQSPIGINITGLP